MRESSEGRRLAAGGPNLLKRFDVEPLPTLRVFAEEAAERGQGAIYLVESGRTLAAAVYLAPLQAALRTVPLTGTDWGIVTAFSLAPVAVVELVKLGQRPIALGG